MFRFNGMLGASFTTKKQLCMWLKLKFCSCTFREPQVMCVICDVINFQESGPMNNWDTGLLELLEKWQLELQSPCRISVVRGETAW